MRWRRGGPRGDPVEPSSRAGQSTFAERSHPRTQAEFAKSHSLRCARPCWYSRSRRGRWPSRCAAAGGRRAREAAVDAWRRGEQLEPGTPQVPPGYPPLRGEDILRHLYRLDPAVADEFKRQKADLDAEYATVRQMAAKLAAERKRIRAEYPAPRDPIVGDNEQQPRSDIRARASAPAASVGPAPAPRRVSPPPPPLQPPTTPWPWAKRCSPSPASTTSPSRKSTCPTWTALTPAACSPTPCSNFPPSVRPSRPCRRSPPPATTGLMPCPRAGNRVKMVPSTSLQACQSALQDQSAKVQLCRKDLSVTVRPRSRFYARLLPHGSFPCHRRARSATSTAR